MGSCLCKEKKSKSSRSEANGDDSYRRSTRGRENCRGNQTDPNDKRAVTGRASPESGSRENNVSFGGAIEGSNIVNISNDRSVTRLSSQSKYEIKILRYLRGLNVRYDYITMEDI